jgi:ABC-type Na+ efflux pump permease subunit
MPDMSINTPANRKSLCKILVIAQRDYIASVRTKAFLFGIIMAPAMFAISVLGVAIIKVKPDIGDRRVAIVDRTGAATAAIIQAAQEKNTKEMFDKERR